ncbi:helix-turn-helix domain-containing protein [Myroides sp. DW712]|uniref:helix-turn-helix domain-containing protein n=1 Tax=Myroides sp. DW712 TaxID=3389800 RepID=UPI003978D070
MEKTKEIETWSQAKIIGAETWDITLFEHAEKGKNDLVRPHKHDFYFLFFVEQGTGIHEIDFIPLDVHAFQIHFLRPQQVHYWKLAPDTRGYQLMFSANTVHLMDRLSALPFFQLDVPPVLSLNQVDYENIQQELKKLQRLLAVEDTLGKEISVLQLFLVLKTIQRYYFQLNPGIEAQVKDNKVQAFKMLLETHFKTQNQVAFYAEKLHITPNYLNIRVKKVLGMSASHCIQQRVILEAERLLTTTDLSIKEIAYTLGFHDTGYFNHYFKKWSNKTPGQFRKSYNILNNGA